MSGYWASNASGVAKTVKKNCIVCRFLDHQPLNQVMGGLTEQQFISPSAWASVELDLFGPIACRSEVNKRSSMKVWEW